MSDSIARGMFEALVKDFRLLLGNGFAESALRAFRGGPQEFRAYEFPTLGEVDPLRFKAWWQLQNLFKRYQFTDDMYDDSTLERMSQDKYLRFQESRAVYHPYRASTQLVLREARRICRSILTIPYEPCRYRHLGRRANHGVPLREAYFDNKLGDHQFFTCPSTLRRDFLTEVMSDKLLTRIYNRLRRNAKKRGQRLRLSEDVLTLTLVPKSWKIKRSIMPLTVFGLYWSYGIGGYVEDCLRMSGLDIRQLSDVHKTLAKRYSRSRTHCTTDLSMASESLRFDILNWVLPRFLVRDLKRVLTKTVNIDGRVFHNVSPLPMGNGATFPIETLVFYCLIKAVGNLMKCDGVFSAYGDDLIYPRRIHSVVCSVFADLGIGVNAEKTFASSHFRESCGGDYYHGVDVRPFLFPEEGLPEDAGRLRRISFLYKIANTLLARWDESEVPNTMQYLLSEIIYLHGRILQVPPSFPETSGLRSTVPKRYSWYLPYVAPTVVYDEIGIIATKTVERTAYYKFSFIGSAKPKSRLILYEDIYYWDSMKICNRRVVDPPVERPSWGRYCTAGATRELMTWFLKTVPSMSFPVNRCGSKELREPLHQSGKPKLLVAQTSAWT